MVQAACPMHLLLLAALLDMSSSQDACIALNGCKECDLFATSALASLARIQATLEQVEETFYVPGAISQLPFLDRLHLGRLKGPLFRLSQ